MEGRAPTPEFRNKAPGAEQPVGDDIWIALAWCVGILVVAYVFAIISYRKKVS